VPLTKVCDVAVEDSVIVNELLAVIDVLPLLAGVPMTNVHTVPDVGAGSKLTVKLLTLPAGDGTAIK
jgi:hypothetical protein